MKLPEQKQTILIILLLFLTAILMTNYFEVGMTGVLAFFVAYLSKGMRKFK
ncbi:MAG: hypothetical protein ACK51P_23110 [Microcystis sp.]|uniref:hypothetical protein n=1 Tax=Microcystis sp. TaxID=1127 RepID=UPI00391F1D31